jgi:hypothetical protein
MQAVKSQYFEPPKLRTWKIDLKVAVKAALTVDAPPIIFSNAAPMPLNLACPAALLLVLLSLHVAEEGSLSRRVV